MDFWDRAQIVRLGNKCRYPLGYLTNLLDIFAGQSGILLARSVTVCLLADGRQSWLLSSSDLVSYGQHNANVMWVITKSVIAEFTDHIAEFCMKQLNYLQSVLIPTCNKSKHLCFLCA